MTMYTKIIANILFPLHERLKGHTSVNKIKELEKSQWLSSEKISLIQTSKLKCFLKDIVKNNPYFRQLFNQLGLSESDLNSQNILAKIPLLDKQIIREHESEFLTDNSDRAIFQSTSGSSGTPLRFAVGNERVSHDVAAKWRATRWWGVDIGDKEAVIWGSTIELTGQGMIKVLRDRLFRSKLFSAQHLTESRMEKLLEDLTSFSPAMIYGYPSILTLLAEFGTKNKLAFPKGQLKVIFCTAEKLYPHQKEIIEDFFQATVANGYGSRDAGFIAHQCPHGGLHISDEDIIAEIIDSQGNPCRPGEIGELIITNLSTRDFPMLRYKTGDLAIASTKQCACGRGLTCFEEVIGRANDVLTATDGAALHGAYIGNIIREDDAIENFQLTQETVTEFSLKIVAYPNQTPNLDKMTSLLHQTLGNDAKISLQITEKISAEQTGKYKYIINNVN